MKRINFKNVLFIFILLFAAASGGFAYQVSRPDFTTIDGEEIKWRTLEGQWVVVNYFAEWCAPCLREVPELNSFHTQTQDKPIRLFAISFDNEPAPQLQNIKTKYAMTFPIISSEQQRNIKVPRPASLPATYIIAPNGEVKKRLLGEQTAQQLFETIELLETL